MLFALFDVVVLFRLLVGFSRNVLFSELQNWELHFRMTDKLSVINVCMHVTQMTEG